MATFTKKLTLFYFFPNNRSRISPNARRYIKLFGFSVNVVKLEILLWTTSNALTSQKIDYLIHCLSVMGFDISSHINSEIISYAHKRSISQPTALRNQLEGYKRIELSSLHWQCSALPLRYYPVLLIGFEPILYPFWADFLYQLGYKRLVDWAGVEPAVLYPMGACSTGKCLRR